MKIHYILTKGGAGGDVYFQRLASAMTNLGHDCLLTFRPKFLEPVYFLNGLFSNKDKQFDLIHSNVECGFAFKKKSIPLVSTVHHIVFNKAYQQYTSSTQKFYHKLLYVYTKKTLGVSDSIVAVSESTRKETERVFGIKNVQVIYNGIDTEIFKPKQGEDLYPGKIKLLFVGNLTKRKGADLLPGIIQQLDNRFILLYTSGLRTKNIFSDDRMIALGKLNQSELVEMYNLCDIAIVPSRLEGFGYSAAEAMACGKPIIATNCSSLPELVTDGKGGFLCEMDNVSDFAKKIDILAADSGLRKLMGEYNRDRVVSKFNISKMSREYQSLYEKLV